MIRIVEASIAIIIIMVALFFVFNQNRAVIITEDYDEMGRDVLEEIASNSQFRTDILEGRNVDNKGYMENGPIIDFLVTRIPEYLGYQIRVCAPEDSCGAETYLAEEVFSQERIISADINSNSNLPKKIRLFLWVK